MNKEEFDLLQYARVLWHDKGLILLVAALGCGIAAAVSFFVIPPKYTANLSMYVYNNQDRQNATINDLNMSVKLADTYVIILKSDTVLKEVTAESGLGYTVPQLGKMVSAQAVDNTEVFKVNITCKNREHARILAQTVANVAPKQIMRVVKAGGVELIDTPQQNPPKTSPHVIQNSVLGFFGGIVVMAVIILLRLMMDKTIKKESDLVETFGLPVLGSIPSFGRGGVKGAKHGG
ncbi:MAG: Wzz/FepE/Etk N-terminal domain-containing protein [Oscillospiraceae bacterium]|nr:Wzz/FepE/Etk N-terminal domain-containing protein [Oscillospiraceae bacterium]